MSKKKALLYKKYYSPDKPGEILDVEPSSRMKTLGRRPFREVADYLEKKKYLKSTEEGSVILMPKGLFLQEAILTRSRKVMHELGAFEYRFPSIFSDKDERVREGLVKKFGSQLFSTNGPRQASYYLKYASDPMIFQYFAGQNIPVPFRAYSPDYFFRLIKPGELKPLLQPREFCMTDFHFFEDRKDFDAYITAAKMNADVMNSLALSKERWFLNIDTNINFFTEHNADILHMLDTLRIPTTINITSGRTHYYSIQNQYVIDCYCNNETQMANLQFDEQNGALFSILSKTTGDPVNIIHGTVFGRTEKVIGLIFGERLEKMLNEKSYAPILPLWLTPIITRIIPLDSTPEVIDSAQETAKHLSKMHCRNDIDLRNISLEEKVRSAEQDWIPIQLIIGEKEIAQNTFSVRDRTLHRKYTAPKQEFYRSLSALLEQDDGAPQITPQIVSERSEYC